jgi:hypothetical protein
MSELSYMRTSNTQSSSVPILCRRGDLSGKITIISEDHNTIKSAITKSSSYRKEAHYKRY